MINTVRWKLTEERGNSKNRKQTMPKDFRAQQIRLSFSAFHRFLAILSHSGRKAVTLTIRN